MFESSSMSHGLIVFQVTLLLIELCFENEEKSRRNGWAGLTVLPKLRNELEPVLHSISGRRVIVRTVCS